MDKPREVPRRRGDLWKKVMAGSLAFTAATEVGKRINTPQEREELADMVLDGQYEQSAEVQRLQNALETTYGIRVYFQGYSQTENHFYNFTAERLSYLEAATALQNLTLALAKYPPDFFVHNHLPRIIIGKNIHQTESSTGIPTNVNVDGFAQIENDLIVLEYQEDRTWFESIVHHELFHILEWRDQEHDPGNESWIGLHRNCRCTPYLGREAQSEPYDPVNNQFVRTYGRVNAREDKATFAEVLFSPVGHALLLEQIAYDETGTLQRKYEMIIADYERWSHGSFDRRYWENIFTRGQGILAKRGWGEYATDYTYYPTYDSDIIVVGTRQANPQDFEGFSSEESYYGDPDEDYEWSD